ncbi:MAG TPA: hypothetical protein VFR33_08360 [Candidatus Dormibacteraeota bacterium]|nr:hypothetical protein [Candidatus Dormibacteraeota bacterium]
MDSLDARITARTVGIDRLNRVTTWVGLAAMAAVGVFAVIAAATIPGKASSTQGTGTASASTSTSTSTNTPVTHHHHDFSNGTTISASSGPPMVVSGGSR